MTMLTKTQKAWLARLSKTKTITIVPYNPQVKSVFQKIKKEVKSVLGKKVRVVHKGATSLGISGQGELDVYIPVPTKKFNHYLEKMKQSFGEPGSCYPLKRARFNRWTDGFKIEVFLINQNSQGWKKGVAFENYLKNHPKALSAYEKLKEKGHRLSVQEYYRRKVKFINNVLAKNSKPD